jgi:hypothetical protein
VSKDHPLAKRESFVGNDITPGRYGDSGHLYLGRAKLGAPVTRETLAVAFFQVSPIKGSAFQELHGEDIPPSGHHGLGTDLPVDGAEVHAEAALHALQNFIMELG